MVKGARGWACHVHNLYKSVLIMWQVLGFEAEIISVHCMHLHCTTD